MNEFDLKSYMRNLVEEQVGRLKLKRQSVLCTVCHKMIGVRCKDVHVDHLEPLFHELCCRFIETWKGGEIQSLEFRKAWRLYHLKEARLQLVHEKCH